MEYQSLFKFYWFGTCLRYLQDASEGADVHAEGAIKSNIDLLFQHLGNLNLTVTERLTHQKLDSLLAELNAKPQGSSLTADESARLRNIVSTIRETLEAEIMGIGAYTPTPKRLDLHRLLNDVSTLFAPNVFSALPPIAVFDFSEAGKCIGFERPTAAAFHILRATEDVLRFYYMRMIRHGRISSPMWGPIVVDLRRHNVTKRMEALNNHLDHIRISFRNPTQHPEATYDIHEVQDLWAVCVDVVNRMVKALVNEKRI